MDIGEKILKLRKEKGFSQEFIAKKLEITRQTVSKWESGLSTPDFDRIVPLCELFDMTPNQLFEVKEPKKVIKEEVEEVEELKIEEPKVEEISEVEKVEVNDGQQWREIKKKEPNEILVTIIIGLLAGFSIASVVGEQFNMIQTFRIIGSISGVTAGAIVGLIYAYKKRKNK